VTSQQDQEHETSAPGGPVAESGDTQPAWADDLADQDDGVIVAEPDDDVIVAEPDDGVIVAEPDDDVIVAEVIDEEPERPADAEDPAQQAGPLAGESGQPRVGVTWPTPAEQVGAGASQQWRDIQATFVDDPRGAVRLAAQATNAALNGVIDRLRSRLDALPAAARDCPEHPETEQLRGELRQYRELCQNLAEIRQRLDQHQPA
jgi:hypothetical protein